MTRDDPSPADWRAEIKAAIGDGGGCAEAWEATTRARQGGSSVRRRNLLGSLGSLGAMALAGCQWRVSSGTQRGTPADGAETRPRTTSSGADGPGHDTPERPESAELLVVKYAETDDASFEVQFIPVTDAPEVVANLDLASDDLLQRQQDLELIGREVPHELDVATDQVRVYEDEPVGGTSSPVMYLNVEQVAGLRNSMCEHEADIWGAYAQRGRYGGRDGQFLLVGQPTSVPDAPCDETDTRRWLDSLYRAAESDSPASPPVIRGSVFWAPEWQIACTFVGNTVEEERLRRDVALYGELNERASAFVNRVRWGSAPASDTSGHVRMTAERANVARPPSSWKVTAAICNEEHSPGQVLNRPMDCSGQSWTRPDFVEGYPATTLEAVTNTYELHAEGSLLGGEISGLLARNLVARYQAYAEARNAETCDGVCEEAHAIADCLVSKNLELWLDRGWDGGLSGTICGSVVPGYMGRCGHWATVLRDHCVKEKDITTACLSIRYVYDTVEDHQAILVFPTPQGDEQTAQFGIVYDPWRTEGEPFWIPIERDVEWGWSD